MAIELYFSNKLEELADKFASVVDLENQTKSNILEGPLTIVPNQNLIKWLQLTIAKRQSVFMNVDFQYLESGLWDLLARLDTRKEQPEMIDNSFLRMLLLCELQTMRQEDVELSPLSRYLLEPGNKKGPGYAVKLWQLTEKMTHLFEEYEFHRSEMIQKWFDNKNQPTGMELCQQRLYLRIRDLRERHFQRTGKRLLSIREYADEVIPAGSTDLNGARKFVHVFGLSQVSAFHLGLIGRIKDYYEIFIYALNPCREFWEDIKTPQEKRWIRRKNPRIEISPEEMDQGELLEWEDNELLSLWGKPGRENIRLLCRLTDYDFNACFTKEANTPSVLHEVQDHILTLTTEKDTTQRAQDTSLQIVSCPGVYREVETVYNSILYNLEKDSGLQLTDIAILVPDISRYKPVIDSVFNRRPASISYNLVDSRADIESVYGQAILGILELATGRFSRKEVFDLIQNPCFMSKWQIETDEPNIWAGWADALNIFHSFDRKATKEKGYLTSGRYTWEQGLQRLRLSRVMSAPNEGTGGRFRHFHGLVPFSDVNTGDMDLLEKFSDIIEKLHHAVMGLTGFRASGEEWKARLLELCDDLLEVPAGFRGEAAVQQSLIEAFGDLKIYDEVREGQSEKGGAEPGLEIAIIREFIKSNLRSISGGYGDYLTEGVTISALQPMRPIPFRIVYIMGMEEGAFPGKADVSSLDLRLLKRRIGDVSLPERNCYLFLEMLLSVRDKLYISHIAKDLQKDRKIQPCSVVNQLRRYVEQKILVHGEQFRITDIPLKGNSERYLENNAVNETSDVLVNYSLADRIACYRENDLWEQVTAGASEETINNIQSFFPDFTVGTERPQKDDRIFEKITLKQLKKFLEDPVLHGLKRHLGMYDEEEAFEEITIREDEPFYSEFPVDYNLKIETLKLWLDTCFSGYAGSGEQTLEEIYECVYESLSRNSDTPDGAFAELDKDELRDDVLVRAGTLSQVMAEMESDDELCRAFFAGEQTDEYIPSINRLPVERFEPVRLIVKTSDSLGEEIETKVELHGQMPWVWKDREGGWHSLVLTASEKTPRKNGPPDKYILEPVLFWMFCLSSENGFHRIEDSRITFHVVYKEAVKAWTYSIDKDAAKEYLRILVSDYLNQERLEWLPFEVVTSQRIKPHKPADGEAGEDEGEKTAFQEQVQEAYAEEKSFLIRLANPCIPGDAFDRVQDRFQVFFRGQGSIEDF
ncbi:MAG: exodeoxyribonuclease V subunit gamma [Thermodesulfobacteriota bacterium]|nr:exodeoxyribonuclease V subunit gamma [Thermodesulfobacteriota bacterium]